jgi:DNA-binding XRE family transcriptional regulator
MAQPNHQHFEAPAASPGRIAAKALFNAGRELGLTQRDLAGIVGVSEATVSRMRGGGFELSGKPLDLALYLIRVFRSLDAIAGGEAAVIKGWIKSANADLHGVPRELMQSPAGLVDVMTYLDAARAPT